MAEIAEVALPRDRPLWELTVVEGLREDRIAFVMKLHHSLADGGAAVALLENAFVAAEHDAVMEAFDPEPLPSDRDLYRSAAATAAHGVAALPGLVGRTISGVRDARTARRAESTPILGPFAGPRSSFNVSLTPDRTFSTLTLPIAALIAAKQAAGASLNDVFLALCGGGVRRYLHHSGALPEASLVASVPMATRTGGPRLGGNHVDNLFIALRSDLADPVARVRAVHQSTAAARRVRAALGPELFEDRAAIVPPSLHALLPKLAAATRIANRVRPPLNLVTSCVRGPRTPLELEGGVVTSLYSSGPILEGIGLNITAWTYVDTMYVSILGCSASLPDPSLLAEDMEAELADWTARL